MISLTLLMTDNASTFFMQSIIILATILLHHLWFAELMES